MTEGYFLQEYNVNESSNVKELSVDFNIVSFIDKFEPCVVTEKTGVLPTRNWKKGDDVVRNNTKYFRTTSIWSFESGVFIDSLYIKDHIVYVLAKLFPFKEYFSGLCEQKDLRVYIVITRISSEYQIPYCIDRESLNKMTAICQEIEFYNDTILNGE